MKKLTNHFSMAGMVVCLMVFICTTSWAMGTIPPAPNVEDEPPVNNFLAGSPWPMTHRNPYCQASSPYAGPQSGDNAISDFSPGSPGLITLAISGKYPDGGRVLWGSSSTTVFKADTACNYISKLPKEDLTLTSVFSTDEIMSGAYTLVDKDNIFYMPRFTKLYAFGDEVEGDRFSDIEIKRVFEIPAEKLRDPDEKIVGLTMTYDGMLAFATSHGMVGLVSRFFDTAYYYFFDAAEKISNSIACDEDGGIYVVTSEKMYRVQWTGAELTTDVSKGGWSATYETGEGEGVRLGAGSGSTPTLMGTGDQDKFVVITDCQEVMHLVLFWRGDIPGDWQQIPGTKDRRIAAQVPVTFGNPLATGTLSEQSVCVRGYGALVVNNEVKSRVNAGVSSLLMSGISPIAPYGAEKFQWDPATRTLPTAWANKDVSYPNGIPCMSAATNMVYAVSQDAWGVWQFEALDWDTGNTIFQFQYGTSLIYNSAYAGTQIGTDSCLYSGTLFGMVRMLP